MYIPFDYNKYKYNVINISYNKLKINNLFLTSKFIIYVISPLKNLKNQILNYNLLSLNLEKKYIKAFFDVIQKVTPS